MEKKESMAAPRREEAARREEVIPEAGEQIVPGAEGKAAPQRAGTAEKETVPGMAEDGRTSGKEESADGSGNGKGLFFRLLNSEGMRYLFIGGCTTMVNLVIYAVLCRVVHLNVNVSNIISVAVAIVFAYVTNKLIVFRSHCGSFPELASECARFIGARLSTMAIEVGGVFLLYEVAHQSEMAAKLATQVLVIIGNYFISRFIVFRDRK